MAYNGFPYTYQTSPIYPQQTIPPQTISGNSLTWVSGEAGAKSYLVSPNTTVALFDSEGQTIYLKSADASGMPSIKTLDYTIRETVSASPPLVASSGDYASLDDINALKKEIDTLKTEIRRLSDGKLNSADRTLSSDVEREPSGFTQ